MRHALIAKRLKPPVRIEHTTGRLPSVCTACCATAARYRTGKTGLEPARDLRPVRIATGCNRHSATCPQGRRATEASNPTPFRAPPVFETGSGANRSSPTNAGPVAKPFLPNHARRTPPTRVELVSSDRQSEILTAGPRRQSNPCAERESNPRFHDGNVMLFHSTTSANSKTHVGNDALGAIRTPIYLVLSQAPLPVGVRRHDMHER